MDKIGSKLKQQRLSKRLSFDDVNAALRTPLKYLSAIENDDVSVFPAEVYYLGSLRRYATYLGLDANELIGEYRKNKITAEQEALPENVERKGRSSAKLWTAAIIVISAIVLTVIVLLILKSSEVHNSVPVSQPVAQEPEKQQAEKTAEPAAQPAKPIKQAEQQAKVVNKPAVPKEEVSQPAVEDYNKKYNLDVEAISNCWVKVTTDGSTSFAGTLEKGSKKHWSADDELGLVIGYVPGLRVKLNGKDIDIASGAKQDINELHFKSEDGNNGR